MEENCKLLQEGINITIENTKNEEYFNHYYPFHLCEKNKPIHKDVRKYIVWIRNIRDKTVQELVTEIGNTLCRGYFGICGDADEQKKKEIFYFKLITACAEAFNETLKAVENRPNGDKKISETMKIGKMNDCKQRVEDYLVAYKQTAMEEVAYNHMERIEESSYEYYKPAYDRMRSLSFVWNTFIKIFWNIARSLEWLTPKVFIKWELK